MIGFGEETAKVKTRVEEDGDEKNIEIIYSKEGKIIKLDGVKLNRTIDLLENVYAVIFFSG